MVCATDAAAANATTNGTIYTALGDSRPLHGGNEAEPETASCRSTCCSSPALPVPKNVKIVTAADNAEWLVKSASIKTAQECPQTHPKGSESLS
eukprot:SAG31_NODE_34037_length_337_cov_0.869748_1_plen_93_part_10